MPVFPARTIDFQISIEQKHFMGDISEFIIFFLHFWNP